MPGAAQLPSPQGYGGQFDNRPPLQGQLDTAADEVIEIIDSVMGILMKEIEGQKGSCRYLKGMVLFVEKEDYSGSDRFPIVAEYQTRLGNKKILWTTVVLPSKSLKQ